MDGIALVVNVLVMVKLHVVMVYAMDQKPMQIVQLIAQKMDVIQQRTLMIALMKIVVFHHG